MNPGGLRLVGPEFERHSRCEIFSQPKTVATSRPECSQRLTSVREFANRTTNAQNSTTYTKIFKQTGFPKGNLQFLAGKLRTKTCVFSVFFSKRQKHTNRFCAEIFEKKNTSLKIFFSRERQKCVGGWVGGVCVRGGGSFSLHLRVVHNLSVHSCKHGRRRSCKARRW